MNNEQQERLLAECVIIVKKATFLLTIVFFFFCIINIVYICEKFHKKSMKEHFIYMRKEQRNALRERFGCSDATISDALNFRRNSENARRLRMAALNRFNGLYF